jgi:broad specificity phosphatase PhoE
MATVLLIRHAEKPTPDDAVKGVDEAGSPDPHELSVLGWQRAGALAALLGNKAAVQRLGLEPPRHLFAPRPTEDKPSERSMHTLQPLADALGLSIHLDFAVGQEDALAQRVAGLNDCVLIAWQHEGLVKIALELAGKKQAVPDSWPTDRYDLIWLFKGDPANGMIFRQLPQRLLAGDQFDPID